MDEGIAERKIDCLKIIGLKSEAVRLKNRYRMVPVWILMIKIYMPNKNSRPNTIR